MGTVDGSSPVGSTTWRDLYLAALFEVNPNQIAARIDVAEKAIVARSRELFGPSGDTVERNSLHSALLALRALRTCAASRRPWAEQNSR